MRIIMLAATVFYFNVNFSYIRYDYRYQCFYSTSQTKNINIDLYNRLFIQLWMRISGSKSKDSDIIKDIVTYFKTLNSSTALQLLEDLQLGHVYPKHIIYAVWSIVPVEDRLSFLRSNRSDLNEAEINEYLLILQQIGDLIITCWNNSVDGIQVQKQIISFLKSWNSKIALEILEKNFPD